MPTENIHVPPGREETKQCNPANWSAYVHAKYVNFELDGDYLKVITSHDWGITSNLDPDEGNLRVAWECSHKVTKPNGNTVFCSRDGTHSPDLEQGESANYQNAHDEIVSIMDAVAGTYTLEAYTAVRPDKVKGGTTEDDGECEHNPKIIVDITLP